MDFGALETTRRTPRDQFEANLFRELIWSRLARLTAGTPLSAGLGDEEVPGVWRISFTRQERFDFFRLPPTVYGSAWVVECADGRVDVEYRLPVQEFVPVEIETTASNRPWVEWPEESHH